MSRLRKRAGTRLREPFGKAGLTVAIVALVMAMIGGAYAAGGLTKAQEKQVTKIAKKYAGKPGVPGAAGTNGTNGKDGTNGSSGGPGAPGASGKSVLTNSFTTENEEDGEPAGEPCNLQGGTELEGEGSGSVDYLCNGEAGAPGEPWTLGGTLPKGSTETGTWLLSAPSPEKAQESLVSLVSFPIQLQSALGESRVHFAPDPSCPGTAAEPKAVEGNLCVYVDTLSNAIPAVIFPPGGSPAEPGAGTAGAFMAFVAEGAQDQQGKEIPVTARGTWAVTAGP